MDASFHRGPGHRFPDRRTRTHVQTSHEAWSPLLRAASHSPHLRVRGSVVLPTSWRRKHNLVPRTTLSAVRRSFHRSEIPNRSNPSIPAESALYFHVPHTPRIHHHPHLRN